jgi:antitoxin FitA
VFKSKECQETHAVLRMRAARAHQPLQEYLLGLPVREASAPTLEEVLDRAGHRTGRKLGFSAAVQAVRDDRDSLSP